MTEIHEFVCDNCGTHAEGTVYHLPKGWYTLGYYYESYLAYDDWRPVLHFCSWECLAKEVKAVERHASLIQTEYAKKDKASND